jgi:hypothetical protein
MAGVGFLLSGRGLEEDEDDRQKIIYEKMKDKEYHGLALFFLGEV